MNRYQSIAAAVAAVGSFLLVQQDVVVPPLLKVIIGAVLVALAAINPNRYEPGL